MNKVRRYQFSHKIQWKVKTAANNNNNKNAATHILSRASLLIAFSTTMLDTPHIAANTFGTLLANDYSKLKGDIHS